MTREKLTNKIYELYEQLQKTEIGSELICREKFEKKLAEADYKTRYAIKRFFEALINPNQK